MSMERINQVLSEINDAWLEQLKGEFEKNSFYNSAEEKIHAVLKYGTTDIYDYETNKQFIEQSRPEMQNILNKFDEGEDITIEKSFEEYIWDNYVPFSSLSDRYIFNEYDEGQQVLSKPAVHVFYEISSIIKKEITGKRLKEQKVILDNICAIIKNNLIEQKKDSTFRDAYRYLCRKGIRFLEYDFSYIISQVIELIPESEKYLEFELNQNELAALLYLLQEGQILSRRETTTSIKIFAKRYFYFKDSKTGEYKPATKIDDKFFKLKIYSLHEKKYALVG